MFRWYSLIYTFQPHTRSLYAALSMGSLPQCWTALSIRWFPVVRNHRKNVARLPRDAGATRRDRGKNNRYESMHKHSSIIAIIVYGGFTRQVGIVTIRCGINIYIHGVGECTRERDMKIGCVKYVFDHTWDMSELRT